MAVPILVEANPRILLMSLSYAALVDRYYLCKITCKECNNNFFRMKHKLYLQYFLANTNAIKSINKKVIKSAVLSTKVSWYIGTV